MMLLLILIPSTWYTQQQYWATVNETCLTCCLGYHVRAKLHDHPPRGVPTDAHVEEDLHIHHASQTLAWLTIPCLSIPCATPQQDRKHKLRYHRTKRRLRTFVQQTTSDKTRTEGFLAVENARMAVRLAAEDRRANILRRSDTWLSTWCWLQLSGLQVGCRD